MRIDASVYTSLTQAASVVARPKRREGSGDLLWLHCDVFWRLQANGLQQVPSHRQAPRTIALPTVSQPDPLHSGYFEAHNTFTKSLALKVNPLSY
jgi:transposase InsO family protein